ncbi:chromosome segregation protein SMC [Thalassotalea ponticola]|uniref:chromosome segregation protein SMC n=1 Tax=Thalassotalea ponticola TaxID=1523392 RepID=UPI0025B4805C|nr:chromosome segregation protein SMC [Thalassotalea ponticola]MDN3652183.1 chromosome segregation protein SMC [Thalassotalea ponticola]
MRLKKIKLAGFKSFVDVTQVPFETDMTAIVGPNGCGKSNIIDAVRWVLGESSAKNLRGDSMTDVIFNGSTARKPVSQASVELVFDNSSGSIQGSLANRSEISIRRVVNRDAQNTYYLNGSKCRRKDITDIFLGTGLGPRSYAIIEQGMISRLIESKPQELRVFIEEAAGVSKYKERRRETENRIRHTRDNLARLADIRQELSQQIEKLHAQAEAATRFRQLKQQERQLKAQLAAIRYRECQNQLTALMRQRSEQQTLLEQHRANYAAAEKDIVATRGQQVTVSDEQQRLNDKILSVTSSIAGIEQRIKHFKEKRQNDERTLNQLEQTKTKTEALIGNHQQTQQQLQQQLDHIAAELLATNDQLAQLKAEQAQMTDLQHDWQQRWDACQQQKAEHDKQLAICENRLQTAQQAQQQTSQRLDSLHSELAQLDIEEQQHAVTLLVESEKQLARDVSQHRQQVNELEQQVTAIQASLAEQQRDEQHLLRQCDKLQSQMDALSAALNEQADWQLEQARWLEQYGENGTPTLAQQIDVEPGWELAVEMVLEHFLAANLVDNWPACVDVSKVALVKNTQMLGEHDCTLDGMSKPVPLANRLAKLSRLDSKVTNAGALANTLNKVLIIDSLQYLDDYVALLPNDQFSLISKSGLWLSTSWMRKGVLTDNQGQLARKAQYRSVKQALAEAEQDLSQCQQRLQHDQKQLDEQQTALSTWQTTLQNTQEQWQQQQQTLQLNQQALQLKQQQQTRISAQIEALTAQCEQEQQHCLTVRNEQKQLAQLCQNDAAAAKQLAEQKQPLLARSAHLSERYQHDAERQQALMLEQQKLVSENEASRQAMQRDQQQLADICQQIAMHQSDAKSSLQPLQQEQVNLQGLLEQRSALDSEQKAIHLQLQQTHQQIEELNARQQQLAKSISDCQQVIQKFDIDSQSYKVKASAASDQLLELNQHMDEVIASLDSKASESQWNVKLARVAKSVTKLGAINLAAIEEFEQQSQRNRFLQQQNDDLQQALATLESAIAKIDRETKAKFKDTFEQINSDLNVLFPKVFGGGSAHLELTSDDLLDTGVSIMARPPGKKNSTIALLSGGEKALTALSLVFAIFRLNPAPFCMLDEVDAPLDDANVGRFCKLVEEMSKSVQFIYISHNKIAMEMASHLTGVTMFEPGVSRMVAVDIDEAIAMAEAV